jgi:uncharacterized protein YbjT (DUF2867 family)
MTVLVIGATGMLGAALCLRLTDRGHAVAGIGQRGSALHSVRPFHAVDIDTLSKASDWTPYLAKVSAVVLCPEGRRSDPKSPNMAGADEIASQASYPTGTDALFTACEAQGLRRVIQISDLSQAQAETGGPAERQLAQDHALMGRSLDWVILRPSIMLGPRAEGTGALIRGLAGLPFLPLLPGLAPVQPVQIDDVIDTVLQFLEPNAPAALTLDLAGPDPLPFSTLVAVYRTWLGWRPARELPLSRPALHLLCRLGDLAQRLRWKPTICAMTQARLAQGSVGDPAAWQNMLGREPASLATSLHRTPAGDEDRWFAALYFQRALLFAVLPLYWIARGLGALTFGFFTRLDAFHAAGLGWLSAPAIVGGVAASLFIGATLLWRPSTRFALWAGIVLLLLTALAGVLILPGWSSLGIWPIILLHSIGLALLPGRGHS